MTPEQRRIVSAYFNAYDLVKSAGFEQDIRWAERLQFVQPDDRYVLREIAWVIVNSGFRYAVARKLWPLLTEAFLDFNPAIIDERSVPIALDILHHERKIRAIVDIAALIRRDGIAQIVEDAKDPPKLTRLPFIGNVTCWHLAKLLGADVVKPDVHLVRATRAAGFDTPLALCKAIREAMGRGKFEERLTVIDSVLWRYGEQQKARGWPSWDALFGECSTR